MSPQEPLDGEVWLEPSQLPNSAGKAVSTDRTDGLPTPTGEGLEMVITGGANPQLQDIHYNGMSLLSTFVTTGGGT